MLHNNNNNDTVTAHSSFQLNLSETLEFSKDLFGEITQYLANNDLANLMKVSKKFKELVEGSALPLRVKAGGRIGTYIELQHMYKMDQLQIKLREAYTALEQLPEHTFKMPVWALILGLGFAAYLALEPYFIFKIYDNHEYKAERNVTRCAQIKNDFSAEALADFKENGCRVNQQLFLFASAFFGVVMPLMTILFAVLAKGTNWEIKRETRISQKEWKQMLSKFNEILTKLESLIPKDISFLNNPELIERAEKNEERLKTVLGELNKKTLTLNQLQKTLTKANICISYKKELFHHCLLFKHQPKKPEPQRELRIDVNPKI